MYLLLELVSANFAIVGEGDFPIEDDDKVFEVVLAGEAAFDVLEEFDVVKVVVAVAVVDVVEPTCFVERIIGQIL